MITINKGGSIIGDSAQATRGREGERERERHTDRQTDRQRERDREREICTKIKVTGKFAIELRFQNAIITCSLYMFLSFSKTTIRPLTMSS